MPSAGMSASVAVAQPVHVAQIDLAGFQRLARPDDDARAIGVEMDDIERLAEAMPMPRRWPIV